MILLKGFYRNFKSKIYLLVFLFIFTIMLVLINFYTFFKDSLNNLYVDNSNVLLITNKEYLYELKKYKSINSITQTILFTKGEENDTISQDSYIVQKDGKIIDSYQSENDTVLNWDDIIPAGFSNIFAIADNNLNLMENEMMINITDGIEFKSELIESLIGEQINLKYNEIELSLEIKGINYTTSPGITISQSLFDKLMDNSFIYGYIIKEKIYNESIKIEEELKERYDDDVTRVSNYDSYSEETSRKIESYEKISFNVGVFIIIISAIFFIIFLICILNLISDESVNLTYEKVLGYSTLNLYKQLFLEELLLLSISFVISLALSIFINFCVRYYIDIFIKYMYINNIVILYCTFLICAFVLTIFKTKKLDTFDKE